MNIRWALGFLGIAAVVALAAAQNYNATPHAKIQRNPSYDGRYAFARIRYTGRADDYCALSDQGPGWNHYYPVAEQNLMKLITHLTRLDARTDSSVIVTADDPELMKYPVAYLFEPGCWYPKDDEIKGLRTYLLKGGFLVVDDFTISRGTKERFLESRRVFETEMRRVLPNGKIVPIAASDPVFNGIFDLDSKNLFPPIAPGIFPEFHGIYEDNDPNKRLLVVANYHNNINQYLHKAPKGFRPVNFTDSTYNNAYKMVINYLIYGFVH